MRKRWEEETREKLVGSINAGGFALLEGGVQPATLSIKPEDAQLLASRGFSVEEVCRWFGVQPVMIGHMEKSTAWGTGLEQMNLWFLTYTLRPILKSINRQSARICSILARKIPTTRSSTSMPCCGPTAPAAPT